MNAIHDTLFGLLNVLTFIVLGKAGFTAVSNELHVHKLYEDLRNQDPPAENDPGRSDPATRERICNQIASSGFFRKQHFRPVDKTEIYDNRNDPAYSQIFYELYSLTPENFFEYTNPYREHTSYAYGFGLHSLKEYVFTCPLEHCNSTDDQSTRSLVVFRISKEYNVDPRGGTYYKPGHFVFGYTISKRLLTHYFTILAEEPAIVETNSHSEVELHYLRRRKYVKPVDRDLIDPVCNVVLGEMNQHYRLCVAISTSNYFKDLVGYPTRGLHSCFLQEISFRTTEGGEAASGRSYKEWMTACFAEYAQPREGIRFFNIYLSRAYRSNEIYVYLRDGSERGVYLENFSTNVAILDEVDSFSFVED